MKINGLTSTLGSKKNVLSGWMKILTMKIVCLQE